jgi:hypothetical protein
LYCRKKGFESVFASVMLGLPTETPEEARETIRVIDELPLDYYMHNTFLIYPGTPIYAQHPKYGYKVECSPGNIRTVHPFNVASEVPPGKKANTSGRLLRDNWLGSRLLSLAPCGGATSQAFEGLVFTKDELSREDVDWLKDVLVIDGLVVQVYSSRAALETHLANNTHLIRATCKPTKRWFSYVTEDRGDGCQALRFVRDCLNPDEADSPHLVTLVPTSRLCSGPNEQSPAGESSAVYVDRTPADAYALYDLLLGLSTSEQLPPATCQRLNTARISSLCRWTQQSGNCRSWAVALVDASARVRLCWYAPPIGSVGDSLPSLRSRHEAQLAELRARRGCSGCPACATCITCPGPLPIPEDEYCRMRKQSPVHAPAEFLSCLRLLNDAAFEGQ